MEITVYRRKTLLQRMLGRVGAWLLCMATGDTCVIQVPGKGVFVKR